MTKEEYIDWKNHPITKVFFSEISNLIREGEEELGSSAGLDSLFDRFRVGGIYAYKNVLDMEIQFDKEDTDD